MTNHINLFQDQSYLLAYLGYVFFLIIIIIIIIIKISVQNQTKFFFFQYNVSAFDSQIDRPLIISCLALQVHNLVDGKMSRF